MCGIATLHIDNFPETLSDRISQTASRLGTSPAQLVIDRLNSTLPPTQTMSEDELMELCRRIRKGFIGPAFTSQQLEAAIDEGRE